MSPVCSTHIFESPSVTGAQISPAPQPSVRGCAPPQARTSVPHVGVGSTLFDEAVQLPALVGAGELTWAFVKPEPPMLVQAPAFSVALVVLQRVMQLLLKQSVAGVVH